MTGKTATAVWEGNEALRPLLVPLDELQPHPRNPRRGDTARIVESLQRFGQQRPVLALPDGTLVAGHHVWEAARVLGWSHLAVVASDLPPEQVDAYLLADNRLSDLGVYDDRLLAELLAPLAEADDLAGLGYSSADVDALLAYLQPADLMPAPADPPPAGQPYGLGVSTVFRLILLYDRPTYEALITRMDELLAARGLDSYSALVEDLVGAAD